jgi:hypothetical protein
MVRRGDFRALGDEAKAASDEKRLKNCEVSGFDTASAVTPCEFSHAGDGITARMARKIRDFGKILQNFAPVKCQPVLIYTPLKRNSTVEHARDILMLAKVPGINGLGG